MARWFFHVGGAAGTAQVRGLINFAYVGGGKPPKPPPTITTLGLFTLLFIFVPHRVVFVPHREEQLCLPAPDDSSEIPPEPA